MLNYYAKFLPSLSTKLAPLNTLLCKSTLWMWGKKQEEAFADAKAMLQSDALLVHYDITKPLILECDMSPYGVGAVLSHRMNDQLERPIGFGSRMLTTAEKGHSQLDKEGLAIVYGVKMFTLISTVDSLSSDLTNRPLFHLFNENKAIPLQASARLQRWALTLSVYQYSMSTSQGSC